MPNVEEAIEKLESRVKALEDRMAKTDTQFAVINTKLSAILWGIGIVASTLLIAIVKLAIPGMFV